MSGRVSLSITLDKGMYAGIAARAATMGKRPAEYVQNLVSAAYLARVGREKGLPSGDDAMDAAVRSVFCLSGEFNADAIARATGFSVGTVHQVLKGFKQVSAGLGGTVDAHHRLTDDDPSTVAITENGVTGGESAAPTSPEDVRGWPAPVIETARTMWANGASTSAIAKAIGKNAPAVQVFMSKRRDVFPRRKP